MNKTKISVIAFILFIVLAIAIPSSGATGIWTDPKGKQSLKTNGGSTIESVVQEFDIGVNKQVSRVPFTCGIKTEGNFGAEFMNCMMSGSVDAGASKDIEEDTKEYRDFFTSLLKNGWHGEQAVEFYGGMPSEYEPVMSGDELKPSKNGTMYFRTTKSLQHNVDCFIDSQYVPDNYDAGVSLLVYCSFKGSYKTALNNPDISEPL